MKTSTADSGLLNAIRNALGRKRSEYVSKNNRLTRSYIYSTDEIVSKDNRLVRATIDISTDRSRGEKEHEG